MNKTKRVPEKPDASHSHAHALLIVSMAVVGVLALAGSTAWFYNHRALPNVAVGNRQVGNATVDEVTQAIIQQSAINLTLVDDNQSHTVPLKDLGVTVNTSATVQNVLTARQSNDLLQNVQLWQTINVPLVFDNDPGKLKAYLQEHYPSVFIDAKDAQLTYNKTTQQFDITPGTDGRGFDIKSFEESLPLIASKPHNPSLKLATAPVKPLIQAAGLKQAQEDANKRVKLAITFTLDGNTVQKVSADDIASWAHVIPDVVKGTASIEFDQAKIQQYITDVVSTKVASPPIDRKVVTDQASGAVNVLSVGREGTTVKDADILAGNILQALTNGTSLDQQISVTKAPFKTVSMSGYGKWIEVDLSKQTTTMYVGDTPVQSFLISSGKARTPTEVGEFKIYAKYPLQTMTGVILGEYYYVPNIKWVSYFDDGEAFHGTYWHHNFGHPMSHGCINMTEADAKILYDFAPVGTKVIVHQ